MKTPGTHFYLIFLGVLILFPFMVLCFYNQPATDDFGYTNMANKYGYWGAQMYWYRNWAGCLLPSMQMSINPLYFHWFSGFKIIPLVYFMFFIALIFFLIDTLIGNGMLNYQKWSITMAIVSVYLYYIPLISHGFFWLTGLATYQTPTLLTLLLLALLYKMKRNGTTNYRQIIFASMLVVFIIQGSETYMVLLLGLLGSLAFTSLVAFRKIERYFLFLLVLASIASLSVILSPGIYSRANTFPQTNDWWHHCLASSKFILLEVISFTFHRSFFLLLIAMVLLPFIDIFLNKIRDGGDAFLPLLNPLLAFAVTFFFSAIIVFPFSWLNQSPPPGRVANTAYFYFVLGSFYTLLCTWNYVKTRRKVDLAGRNYRIVQGLCFAFALCMLLLPNNVRAAYADLLLGRAALYKNELDDRFRKIETCRTDTCVVPPLDVYPVTISYMDITDDPSRWENEGVSTFFGKKAVYLSSPKVKK